MGMGFFYFFLDSNMCGSKKLGVLFLRKK